MTPPLGVYVHWPYCARICPYCDFNVYKTREIDPARWRAALVRDLSHWAARTPARNLRSLYFGGGTPSLAPISVIEGVIEACADLWGFELGAEITLEANPTDAEGSRFEAFARAGVNRLSLGVQSFDDAALKFLGRDHDGASAKCAVEAAMKAFDRMTFDLIYALPGQSAPDWRRALGDALSLGPRHLSLYQLTIEPGTAFAKAVDRRAWTPPEDDITADLFDIAQEMTAAAGLPAYEISNHAAPGDESRHNLLYWTGGDYVGVGPGAHGRLSIGADRIATETERKPEAYLALTQSSACGATGREPLSPEEMLTERLAMGLRLSAGVELTEAEFAVLGARWNRLANFADEGLITVSGLRIAASDQGRRILDALVPAILL